MATYEPLRDKKGRVLYCGHSGCWRPAVRIVSWEVPRHKEFRGQTHDCCNIHSRPTKADRAAPEEEKAGKKAPTESSPAARRTRKELRGYVPGPGHCEVVEGCQEPKAHNHCAAEGCPAVLDNHYWARVRAEDWFSMKDGTFWCPEHVPEWVPAWRARRAAEKAEQTDVED